jgi:hypothetical protein
MCCVPLLAVSQTSQPAPQKAPQITFTDVTEKVGIHWKHVNGATPDKYLIETMGGGAAFLDYNRDGRLDIFLVNSGCHKFSVNCTSSGNALYRQNADGTFTDVTKAAGLTSSGYGQGVAVGDFDNDGYPDIYVTGFPRNYLFHNNGDGTFTDITGKAGVAASGWSTSAVFFDYNHDGLPDLFVARYLDWDYDKNIWCGERRPGYRTYCHPDQFKPTSSILYRNNGDGTFTDVTKEAGVDVPGKALGAVAFDFNRDGWLDLFVANDAVRNHLFRNNKNGTFTEMALDAEVAYSSMGKPQSGMGVDAADVDGDGWPDLWVTNIDYEPNNLLHNNHDETFTDVTIQSHLGSVALLFSGFGTRFVDFDNDGWLDMFVLNGHPLDNVELYHEGVSAQERPFLLHNIGGKQFEEVGPQHGDVFTRKLNGRGLAVGDFDNDGDEDILLVQNGGSPILLRNDGGNRNAWIGFELEGTRSGRDAIGAVVTVTAGGRKLVRELVGGASYCSAHDQRLLIGLGNAEKVTNVVINWPSGAVSTEHDLVARRYYKLKEPGDAAPRARSSVSPP